MWARAQMAGREEATWWRAPPCPATCPAHGCVGVQGAENSGLDERERRDIRYGRIAERRGDSPPTQLSPLAARARGSSCAPALDPAPRKPGCAHTSATRTAQTPELLCAVYFLSLSRGNSNCTDGFQIYKPSNGVPASQGLTDWIFRYACPPPSFRLLTWLVYRMSISHIDFGREIARDFLLRSPLE